MIPLSKVLSYLICPRLCYYSLRDDRAIYTEKHAVKDIYVSLRMGFDIDWAVERAKLNPAYDEEIFKKALNNFIMPNFTISAKDWDVVFKSEKLGIVACVDEITTYEGETPLIVSLKAPENGVWFSDMMRAGVISLIADYYSFLFYYAYSGELREVKVDFSLRRRSLKLVERVKRLSKGFLPERREGERCKTCIYSRDCTKTPETFASKFL